MASTPTWLETTSDFDAGLDEMRNEWMKKGFKQTNIAGENKFVDDVILNNVLNNKVLNHLSKTKQMLYFFAINFLVSF